MALNPRMVNTDTDVIWDGGIFHATGGTVADIPPGSALETAYGGPGNLTDLTGQDALNISNGALPDGIGGGTG